MFRTSKCSCFGSATRVEGTIGGYYESLGGSITSMQWHIKPPLTTIRKHDDLHITMTSRINRYTFDIAGCAY